MLSSVRLLDLSRVLAGPLATMMLADLGAKVIKVERPQVGDDTRGWGPPFDDRGESAYYLSVNRNKKSIALDIEHHGDREVLLSLAREADVVLDNFKPGTLERRGISPEDLLESNPRLIWCTITGFGEGTSRAGYDLVVQGEAGWMAITGEPNGEPMKVGVALADIVAGKDAAIAILSALVGRSVPGQHLSPGKRRIHISLAASARAALINVAQNSLVTGNDARRWGNQHPNLVPYQLFHASDRAMVIAVGNDSQWSAFTDAAELHDLGDDEKLRTNAGRIAERDRIVARISERLRERSSNEWMELFDRVKVPAGLVKTVVESLGEAEASALTGIAPSVPGSVRLPPPLLDEHGDAIRENGWATFDFH